MTGMSGMPGMSSMSTVLSTRSQACLDGAALAPVAAVLWSALSRGRSPEYPGREVAAAYCAWARATPAGAPPPFSLGLGEPLKTADKMRADAARAPSRPDLVRGAPVAVWGVSRGLSPLAVADAARQDAALSDPRRESGDAVAAYAAALAHLLRADRDVDGALRAAAAAAGPEILKSDADLALVVKHLRARTPSARSERSERSERSASGRGPPVSAAAVAAALGALHGGSGATSVP